MKRNSIEIPEVDISKEVIICVIFQKVMTKAIKVTLSWYFERYCDRTHYL